MKKMFLFALFIGIAFMNVGCVSFSEVDAGEEGVLIYQPWFFGSGGVDKTPIKTGLTWTMWSTDVQRYPIIPIKRVEAFVDLTAKDNVAIDFNTYLTLQIQEGNSPLLHEKSGARWYKNKVMDFFRTVVRNEGRTRTSIELRTKPDVINTSQAKIKELLKKYIKEIGLPVNVIKVVIGKVVPPDEVLKEAERTAAQKQREQTQTARAKAELSRAFAEKNKALADKAFASQFKMTTDQFLRNKELDIMEKAVGTGNVSLIMNASNSSPIFKVK